MVPTMQCVRIPGTPFSLTPTTTTSAYRMTVADDDTRRPISSTYGGEVPCCSEDHQEEGGVSGENSHCGGGCCAGDEADRESSVGNCKDSCCGHQEDQSVAEEPTREEDHQDGVPGVAESHCGDGCCGGDEGDCESVVDNCEDSCCGHEADHGVVEEFVCKDDPQGTVQTVPILRSGEFFD